MELNLVKTFTVDSSFLEHVAISCLHCRLRFSEHAAPKLARCPDWPLFIVKSRVEILEPKDNRIIPQDVSKDP